MTTANLEEERFSHEVRLDIKLLEGDTNFQLTNVLTTESLPVTRRHMATNEDSIKEMAPLFRFQPTEYWGQQNNHPD